MPSRCRFFCVLILRITSAALCHSFCQLPAAAQAKDEVTWEADSQSTDGRVWRFLRGHVEIRKEQMVLTADEADYNEQTHEVEARGNVHFSHPGRKEDVYASRFHYNLDTEVGIFYQVHGTVSSASQGSPRVLHTNEPFYFQGETAQKIKDHYVVYNGWLTDCKVPHPWWTFGSPRATIVPGRYALLRRPLFRLRKVPLFYAPA